MMKSMPTVVSQKITHEHVRRRLQCSGAKRHVVIDKYPQKQLLFHDDIPPTLSVLLTHVIHDLKRSNSLLPVLSIVDHKTTSWLSTENWTSPCGQLVTQRLHTRPSPRKLWKSACTWATGRQWWQSWPAIGWPAGTALHWDEKRRFLRAFTHYAVISSMKHNRNSWSNLGATWTGTWIHSFTHLTPASPTEWQIYYCANACSAVYPRESCPSVCRSVKRMDCEKTKESSAH